MTDIAQEELNRLIESHERWLRDEEGGMRLDLSGVNLEVANLYGANLYGATLYSAYLKGANLCRANLKDANLEGAYLEYAYLKGANLCRANLKDANLEGAYLEYANLTGANLCRANLKDANLEGANLKNANLKDAIGDGIYIKNINELYYPITYTHDRIQIGCKNNSIEEWLNFSDSEILAMDGRTALKFWRESKDKIFEHIAANPAKPTKEEHGNECE
jgi:hypothetical protein